MVDRLTYETRRRSIVAAHERVLASIENQIATCTSPEHYYFKVATEEIKKTVQARLAKYVEKMDAEARNVEPLNFEELLP